MGGWNRALCSELETGGRETGDCDRELGKIDKGTLFLDRKT